MGFKEYLIEMTGKLPDQLAFEQIKKAFSAKKYKMEFGFDSPAPFYKFKEYEWWIQVFKPNGIEWTSYTYDQQSGLQYGWSYGTAPVNRQKPGSLARMVKHPLGKLSNRIKADKEKYKEAVQKAKQDKKDAKEKSAEFAAGKKLKRKGLSDPEIFMLDLITRIGPVRMRNYEAGDLYQPILNLIDSGYLVNSNGKIKLSPGVK